MICWFLAKALIALRINVLQHFWEKAAAASLTTYYQGCFWMTSLPRWFAVGLTMSSKLLIYGCVNFALQLKLLLLLVVQIRAAELALGLREKKDGRGCCCYKLESEKML